MSDRPMDDEPMPADPAVAVPEAADPAVAEAPAAPADPAAPAAPPDPAAPAAPTDPPDTDGVTVDAAGLAASEAAAADRADTAAAIALVMASARAKAEAAAAAAATDPDPSLADASEVQRRSRRVAIRGMLAMLARGAIVLALFVAGIALGAAAFQRSDQVATTAPVVDPAVDGAQPPPVVQEFVTALAGGDADSLRSALQAETHARLTSEFRRFDIQSISAVDTLGTHVDGPRSATEVVMQGTTTAGAPISLNLIILTDGNAIEGFR
jgi:hypothetical protein